MQQQSCLVSDFWCNLTESACQRHLTWSCSCQAMVLCYLISSLQHSRCPLSRRQVQWLPLRHTEIFSLSLLNIRVLTSIGKPRFFYSSCTWWAINSWQWTQTMSHIVESCPWQNWMAAYLGYTLQMKMLFRGWPVVVYDTHTRRRTSELLYIQHIVAFSQQYDKQKLVENMA